MLGDEVMRRGGAKQRCECGPIDDAVTGGGPAVIGLGAGRGRVLGLDDVDAIGEVFELGRRVGAGPDDPAASPLWGRIGGGCLGFS